MWNALASQTLSPECQGIHKRFFQPRPEAVFGVLIGFSVINLEGLFRSQVLLHAITENSDYPD
jgi:hypothetical protein